MKSERHDEQTRNGIRDSKRIITGRNRPTKPMDILEAETSTKVNFVDKVNGETVKTMTFYGEDRSHCIQQAYDHMDWLGVRVEVA